MIPSRFLRPADSWESTSSTLKTSSAGIFRTYRSRFLT
jgi:hypothetical protein